MIERREVITMWLRTDHRPRVDFYVRQGLVKQAPTDEQIEAAARLNLYGAGVIERVRYYARHPLDLLPTKAKRRAFEESNEEFLAGTSMSTSSSVPKPTTTQADDARLPTFDRFVRRAFQVSPIRFAVQCWYNPWNAIPGTGLNVPTRYLIAHIVHSPHPTALWDLQLIHPDPGALDELEREIEMASNSNRMKARVYRALAQRPGYYDYLRWLVPRVRRFDYPPSPPGFNPILENLVNFLNWAANHDPGTVAPRA